MADLAVTCTHCPQMLNPYHISVACPQHGVHNVGKAIRTCCSPFNRGSGTRPERKQACRFIPESFCFCDTLLSQPDRMRNKYHQNTTREAILEVFIAQPRWRMFGRLPRQPILTVFPSQFLNFWALAQRESRLFEVCLSLFMRAFCEGLSREGS